MTLPKTIKKIGSRFRWMLSVRKSATYAYRSALRPARSLPGSSKHFGPPRRQYWHPKDYFSRRALPARCFTQLKVEEPAPPRQLPAGTSRIVLDSFQHKLARTYPERHVSVFPNGRFWAADSGTAITDDDGIVFTLSPHVWHFPDPNLHPSLAVLKLPPVLKVGRCHVLHSYHARLNYWHWMVDLLPRFQMLHQAGFDSNDPESRILIPGPSLPFQKETLAALGIPAERLIHSSNDLHIEAEELVVPAHTNLSFNTDTQTYRPEDLDFVRRLVDPDWETRHGGAPVSGQGRRIFLSRASGRRHLRNEPAVVAALKPLGFELVRAENLSLKQQAELFYSASVIAGMHGGAFTNLIFCRPGTQVIEIHSPLWIKTFFWDLAENRQLRYSAYCESGPAKDQGGLLHRFSDITVDPAAFAKHVAQVLSSS